MKQFLLFLIGVLEVCVFILGGIVCMETITIGTVFSIVTGITFLGIWAWFFILYMKAKYGPQKW